MLKQTWNKSKCISKLEGLRQQKPLPKLMLPPGKQERLANAKVSMQQQCMYEDP